MVVRHRQYLDRLNRIQEETVKNSRSCSFDKVIANVYISVLSTQFKHII